MSFVLICHIVSTFFICLLTKILLCDQKWIEILFSVQPRISTVSHSVTATWRVNWHFWSIFKQQRKVAAVYKGTTLMCWTKLFKYAVLCSKKQMLLMFVTFLFKKWRLHNCIDFSTLRLINISYISIANYWATSIRNTERKTSLDEKDAAAQVNGHFYSIVVENILTALISEDNIIIMIIVHNPKH